MDLGAALKQKVEVDIEQASCPKYCYRSTGRKMLRYKFTSVAYVRLPPMPTPLESSLDAAPHTHKV
jgi:hypothetical protein